MWGRRGGGGEGRGSALAAPPTGPTHLPATLFLAAPQSRAVLKALSLFTDFYVVLIRPLGAILFI